MFFFLFPFLFLIFSVSFFFFFFFFFFNDTATTEIYTFPTRRSSDLLSRAARPRSRCVTRRVRGRGFLTRRSEEHTSELQSRPHLVCRLLLEKKKKKIRRKHRIKKKKNYNN